MAALPWRGHLLTLPTSLRTIPPPSCSPIVPRPCLATPTFSPIANGPRFFLSSLATSPGGRLSSFPIRPPVLSTAASQLDTGVLHASVNASVTLVVACTFVVWLQKIGLLPAETPSILSQISFNVLIPCFTMSKVFQTISSSSDVNAFVLPLLAIVQVLVGAILGKLACKLIYRRFKLWLPLLNPVFLSSDAASSLKNINDQETQCFAHAEKVDPMASKQLAAKEAVITLACAFGNSLTLPLVYLSGLLSTIDMNNATGYLALFTVGWSFCLWSVGYRIIGSSNEDILKTPNESNKSIYQIALEWLKQLGNPPLYGIFFGLLSGGSPLSYLFLPPKSYHALINGVSEVKHPCYFPAAAGLLRPIMEAASLLGSATLAVQTIVLASSLANSIQIPSIYKLIRMLEKVTLGKDYHISNTHVGYGGNTAGPGISLEAKAFWVIFVIRLFVMPIIWFIVIGFLQQRKCLPPDSLWAFVVLVEAAMPTAQNLVVLAQLQPSTQPLAGILADLIVRQYMFALIPLTIWMSTFLSFMRGI